jgi:septal ring factor EnvC (AmiA/AmiB activator)
MTLSTQEFKKIGSQMEVMRHFIQQNPQRATELFQQCPELHEQIKEIVHSLRELQNDLKTVEENKERLG